MVPVIPSSLESEIFDGCHLTFLFFSVPHRHFNCQKGRVKKSPVFSEKLVYINRKGRGKCDKKIILNKSLKGLPLGILVLGIISETLYTSMSHCSPAVLLKDLQVIVIHLARDRDCHIPRDIFKRYVNLRNSHLCQPLSIQLTRIFCSTPNTSFSAFLHR